MLDLADNRASDPRLAGAKAASLAHAMAAGLSVVPGFVITTTTTATIDAGHWTIAVEDEVRAAWKELSGGGQRALVVRSSSTAEDLDETSMAGQFRSVVGVQGWDDFREAVDAVLDSRRETAAGDGNVPLDHPMAVLVQPLVDAVAGGVMFGVDPVTGRSDRLVVAAVAGGPDRLVSGEVEGTRYELDRAGTQRSRQDGGGGARLNARQLRHLVGLADQVVEAFGGPQDVEWAIDGEGVLRLLQSRPVTTEVRGVPSGPVLGPGPVAETFPEPLTRLEEDLWVAPLREALREALRLSGAAARRQLEHSPVVVSLPGGVAVDLELFGEDIGKRSLGQRLDPRPRLRRLRAAWRVGRLRAALADLALDLVQRTDAELAAVPSLDELTDRQLVALLDRCRQALTALHGHEVLIGLVVDPGTARLAGASVALRVLSEARAEGTPDDEVVQRHPVVLALVPPHIQPTVALPAVGEVPALPLRDDEEGDRNAVLREALRLRVRWIQELSGRAAWALGGRLADAGAIEEPGMVGDLPLEDLRACVCGRAAPWRLGLDGQRATEHGEPLPARFQLSDRGRPVPVVVPGEQAGAGAGGGTATGPVHQGPDPPEGAVLVVRTLDPALAAVLPRLAALVAETGNPLAHMAILAREANVPTVVGVVGAVDRLSPGTVVRVDGATGEVTPVMDGEEGERK
ncbi:MAG: pyruvate, phosphate dikinase [Actinobacteria bacterium]|nr:pyruvate, phosphate dikinase [Actinomycetota bacterium]